MGDQIKNVLIGAFVLAAGAIVIFILLFLHPSVGDEGKKFKVLFSNIDKISHGTRVNFSGKPVGEVVGIKEIARDRSGPISRDRMVYTYELELQVDSSVDIFDTDEIILRTSGLLGEKSVEIVPLAPIEGKETKKITTEIIYGSETGSVEETFKEFKEVADRLELTLDVLYDIFKKVQEEKVPEKIGTIANHLVNITEALDRPDDWSEIIGNIHELSEKINNSWDTVDDSLNAFADSLNNTKIITELTKELVEGVKEGKGTVGRLLVQDDLYLRATALMSKADTIMNDMNHYGLLFHLDKGWQRLRARRMNLMQQLSSPAEFRNFFNDELDQVTTALARVTMIVDQTQGCPPFDNLYNNCQFTSVYAELLRRVDMLEETLKMYNQQLVDTTHQCME